MKASDNPFHIAFVVLIWLIFMSARVDNCGLFCSVDYLTPEKELVQEDLGLLQYHIYVILLEVSSSGRSIHVDITARFQNAMEEAKTDWLYCNPLAAERPT